MATSYRKKIVTSGLQLYLDAGNSKSFSPEYSNYFDGTGDYLRIASSTPLVLSGNVWTIEAWIYPDGDYSAYRIIVNKREGTNAASYDFYLNITNGYLAFYNGTAYTSTMAPTAYRWNHVAAVYDGTNINLYMNGNRVLQSISSNPDNGGNLFIGADTNGTSNFFRGCISNVRILKGTALYTGSTYTVPASPLTAIANTSLLTCQNATFVDNSTNNLSITSFGDTKSTLANPFNDWKDLSSNTANASLIYGPKTYTSVNGTGLVFDGVNDACYIPAGSVPITSAGVTISVWLNHRAFSVSSRYNRYVSLGNEIAVLRWDNFLQQKLHFYTNMSGILKHFYVPTSIVVGQTYNIVATCDGTTQTVYVQGVQVGSQTPGGTLISSDGSAVISNTVNTESFDGTMYQVLVYNRALTATEILQNFTVHRKRFGV